MEIWRMRVACWVLKATDTHSEYVTLIAFPLQKWLHERTSMLRHTPAALCDLGIRRAVNEKCVLLGHYAAGGVDSIQQSVNNLWVPNSVIKNLGPSRG